MRAAGRALPSPEFPLAAAAGMLAAFFVAATAEETGWSGYALERMQAAWTPLHAAVVLGIVWAVWHVVPLLQADRAWTWIAWHSLETVASRVLIVWLYNETGRSVFAAVLYHTMDNVSWLMFPTFGSHYAPQVSGPITATLAVLVVIACRSRLSGRRRAACL